MAENYLELQIKINPEMADIVSEICFENLPCEGVVLAEETYKDLEIVSTTEGTLKVFLTEKADVKKFLKEQRELLKSRGFSDEELGSWGFTLTEKPNEDWSKKWKEKWDVTHVSDRITVVPDWIEYAPHREDEVIIRLEPGCAFGTGTHQTTQLCMKAIEKYMPCNAKMADIGMGSGILAICAAKFGASEVYGCDNDPTVIDVAKENAQKNSVSIIPRPLRNKGNRRGTSLVTLFPEAERSGEREEFLNEQGDFSNSGEGLNEIKPSGVGCRFELNTADKITEKYDFICANILHNVLAEIMGDLKAIMNDGASMVLSGILDEKKHVVLEAIQKQELTLIEEMHQEQWVALVVKK